MVDQKEVTSSDLQAKKTKHRSPNYPYIGLEKALERAFQIYEKAKFNFVPLAFVHQLWGYKEAVGNQVVAALKSFGLAEVKGEKESRQVRISELGQKILRNHPQRDLLLKEAALKPDLHEEIWGMYAGDLPDNSVIRTYLVWERKFNEDSVDSFIAQFRATIAFAGLAVSDNIANEENQPPSWEKSDMSNTGAKPALYKEAEEKPAQRDTLKKDAPLAEDETELKFNISQNSRARIIFTGQVTQEAIELLAEMLNIQKRTFKKEADLSQPQSTPVKEVQNASSATRIDPMISFDELDALDSQ